VHVARYEAEHRLRACIKQAQVWPADACMLAAASSPLPVSGLDDALDLKKCRNELGMLRFRLGVAAPIGVVSIVNADRSNGDFVNPNDKYKWTS
jgi:hypothetical protein